MVIQFSKRLSQLFLLMLTMLMFASFTYAQTTGGTGSAGGTASAASAGSTGGTGSSTSGPQVSSVDASTMLANIVSQLPALTKMVSAIAYVLGMGFLIASIMKFKQYGEARTMMSMQHHLTQPIVFMVVGAFLMYLPSAVNTTMSTFWANPNPYGYLEESSSLMSTSIKDSIMVVQFFGLIAFIRGLVIISHLGGHHGGQGGIGKGLTHIIGGIFCINIYQFVKLVLFTLGLQIS